MYEKFYGLQEPPFNLTPDSRFLYMSNHHREAMAALLYGIRERKGFTLLTGEIGSGKTTLCRAIVKELEETPTQIGLILNSYLDEMELLQTINQEMGLDASATTRKGLIDVLNAHLLEQHAEGRNVALIIDEAQNLADSVLEQARMLGNLETENQKLLQIVLIGQPELQTALHGPKLEQLNQRIAVRYHLQTLESEEIEPYIQHRLRVAGLSAPLEFSEGALELIHEYTSGVPRKINLICDRALLAGYVASTYSMDEAIIRSAAMDVGADQWQEPTQATTEDSLPGARRSSWWPSMPQLLFILAFVTVLALVPVLLSEYGFWGRLFGGPSGGAGGHGTTPTPAAPANTVAPTPTPALTPGAVALSDPGTNQDEGTTPVFTLVRPELADPWTYDKNQVVRVSEPAFCRTAAVLTLLATWGIEVNLEDFRGLTSEEAGKLDIVELNRDKGLRSVQLKGGLRRATVYDVPAIVEIADPEKRLSSHVVLVGLTPRICRIADPMMSVQEVPRAMFESFWRKAFVIYFDPDTFDKLVRGKKSEGAQVLQQTLSDLGFYRGPITGEFDRTTVSAIEYLQRYFELFPTGQLDPVTVMLITSHGQPDRPRLAPEEDPGR